MRYRQSICHQTTIFLQLNCVSLPLLSQVNEYMIGKVLTNDGTIGRNLEREIMYARDTAFGLRGRPRVSLGVRAASGQYLGSPLSNCPPP